MKKTGDLNRSGRPRSESSRKAILEAANELLAEKGLAKVTSELIAERAGVSKATIYRWWPNKSAVLMDGFLLSTAQKIPFKHSQPGFESIRQQMKKVAQLYSGKTGKTIATLIAQGQIDQELAEEFRNRYILPRRTEARIALEAAIQAGELDSQINIETTIDALYGPLFYRLLVGHGPIDEEFVDSLADHVLGGIRKRIEEGSPDEKNFTAMHENVVAST